VRALRRLVPFAVRRAVSARLAELESDRVERDLAALAAGDRPIVAGPWLGEVGFELLYWVPFLAWFTERFAVDSARLLVVSRGGTSSWYAPFAGHYRDVLDYMTPDAFHAQHETRVREIGEQKQTRTTGFDRQLVARIAADAGAPGAGLLHPSTMYHLLRPFWWGHLDESWVHRHARYRRFTPPPRADIPELPESYCAVKFYFNDCFPASDRNRVLVNEVVARLAQDGPVVSLSAGVTLDGHGACSVATHGVLDLAAATPASRNLHVQSTVVAHARAFVGTYGGFAYLAPFYGVRATTYYGDADGFARSHLRMARSAFDVIGAPDLLQLHPIGADPHNRQRSSV
jgi:hypothetical protein